MNRVGPSGEFIMAWVEVLDDLTYYDLFGIDPDASDDQVHAAFHRFCDAFHPDRHLGRSGEQRAALSRIFKRGTEACLILSDEALRAQYDSQIASAGSPRPSRIGQSYRTRQPSQAPGIPRLEEAARSPSSRPFARRAEELIQIGDFRQAKLQLVMANHLDPNNEVLEAALREIEGRLTAPR
jgi:curved DNA-binding protein CbpA